MLHGSHASIPPSRSFFFFLNTPLLVSTTVTRGLGEPSGRGLRLLSLIPAKSCCFCSFQLNYQRSLVNISKQTAHNVTIWRLDGVCSLIGPLQLSINWAKPRRRQDRHPESKRTPTPRQLDQDSNQPHKMKPQRCLWHLQPDWFSLRLTAAGRMASFGGSPRCPYGRGSPLV